MELTDKNLLLNFLDSSREMLHKDEVREFALHMPIVESRPKGEWVRIRRLSEYGELYCDQCGQEHPEQTKIWNYCPNCGAQMSKGKVVTCDGNKCYENEINGIDCEECECCADMRGEQE